jgi:hypothetical protein
MLSTIAIHPWVFTVAASPAWNQPPSASEMKEEIRQTGICDAGPQYPPNTYLPLISTSPVSSPSWCIDTSSVVLGEGEAKEDASSMRRTRHNENLDAWHGFRV